MTPHILGVVYALVSAVVWGTGDFSGGLATRSQNQYQVLLLVSIPGMALLLICALLVGEALPGLEDTAWALGAGLSGAFGIAALYKGLTLGNAAAVAPTAAVIGAGLPVVFSCLSDGFPGMINTAGFMAAVFGIYLVSRPKEAGTRLKGQATFLAVLAGMGFGGFFTLIAQVEQGQVFFPLVLSKVSAISLAVATLFFRREGLPRPWGSPVALVAGLFDAGGNIFFMLARQYTRLDVAAVLSSMYPAVTVLLAWLVLKEEVSASQWQGVALCILAIALIGM
jgi:drug/metabolite transporter (DMT)-like permease